jgi:hypothetical protein
MVSSVGGRDDWTHPGMSGAPAPGSLSRKAVIDAMTLVFVNRPCSLVLTLPQFNRPKSKKILVRDNGRHCYNSNAGFI